MSVMYHNRRHRTATKRAQSKSRSHEARKTYYATSQLRRLRKHSA